MNPSIVDYLKSKGQASDFASRSKLATSNNISNYTGTAEQNTQLLKLLQKPATTPTTTVPTNIPSSVLPTSTPNNITLPNVSTPNAQIGLNTTVAGIMAPSTATGKDVTPTKIESDSERLRRETLEAIKSYTDPNAGYSAKSYQYEQEAGLTDKKNQLSKIDVQDIALQNNLAKFKEEQLNKNPGGLFGTGVEQLISANERATSSQRTDLAIQKLALQGDINTAINVVKQRLDAEFEPIKQKIDYNKEALTLLNNDLTEKEKVALQNQTRMLESLLDGKKTFQTILDDAGKAGAPIDVVNQASKAYATGDRASAIALLAPYVKGTADVNRESMINTTVNQIAGAFDNEPAVKEYNTVASTLEALKGASTSATDDIQRVYAFAKIMDPNSVVREGEYKTIQDYTVALFKRAGINIARAFNEQGFLTDKARADMQKTLENVLKAKQKSYNNVKNQYQKQIDDAYSGNPRQITDYSSGYTQSPSTKSTSTGEIQTKTYNVNGKQVTLPTSF